MISVSPMSAGPFTFRDLTPENEGAAAYGGFSQVYGVPRVKLLLLTFVSYRLRHNVNGSSVRKHVQQYHAKTDDNIRAKGKKRKKKKKTCPLRGFEDDHTRSRTWNLQRTGEEPKSDALAIRPCGR